MTTETFESLVRDVVEATSLPEDTVRRALASGDPAIVELAQSLVHLASTRDAAYEEMRRSRENIRRAA